MRLLSLVAVISLTMYVDSAGNDIPIDVKKPKGGTVGRANNNNDLIRTQLFGPNGQEYGTQGFGFKRYRSKGFGSPGSQFQKYNSQALRPQGLQSQEIKGRGTQAYTVQGFGTSQVQTQALGAKDLYRELEARESGTKDSGPQETKPLLMGQKLQPKRIESQEIGLQVAEFRPNHSKGLKRQSWKKLVKQQRPYAAYWVLDFNAPRVAQEQHAEYEPQKPWEPPQYHKALEDFDAATKKIGRHFKREPHTYRNDNNFRFTVVAVVVDGLAKIVAERGQQYYDVNYSDLVKSLAEKAVVNPMVSVDVIRCIYRHANESIQKLRTLINQKWDQFACKAQPNECDTVLYELLRSYPNTRRRYEKQADLLLKLGEVASTYLNTYSNVFEAVSEQNSYQYLITAKEVIRELVEKTARVRIKLYPNGGPTQKQCASSYTEFNIGY